MSDDNPLELPKEGWKPQAWPPPMTDPIPAAAAEAAQRPALYTDHPRVEYVTGDRPVWHDRVDGWFSLIRDMKTNEIVGACIDLPKDALPHLSSSAEDVAGLVERLRADDLLHNRGPDYEPLRIKASPLRLEAASIVERDARCIRTLASLNAAIAAERDEARRQLDSALKSVAAGHEAIDRMNAYAALLVAERDALAERVRVAESLVQQRDRLAETSRKFWVRAAKAAMTATCASFATESISPKRLPWRWFCPTVRRPAMPDKVKLTKAELKALAWIKAHEPVSTFPIDGPAIWLVRKLEKQGSVSRVGHDSGRFGFVQFATSEAGRLLLAEERGDV